MAPQTPYQAATVPAPTQTQYQDLLGRLDTLYSEQPSDSSTDSTGPALHVLQPAQVHHQQIGQAEQQQGGSSEHSE